MGLARDEEDEERPLEAVGNISVCFKLRVLLSPATVELL